MSGPVLLRGLDPRTLVVAIDPGKVEHRVWLATGEQGLVDQPLSLSVARSGIDQLERLIAGRAGGAVPVAA